MQFWVYILRCRDGSYYTGHKEDLEKRMWEHQQGKGSLWTRVRLPVELVWCDWVNERYDALAFERRVKNWSRAKKEALIAGDWARVGYFAKPPHERASAPLPCQRPSTSLGTNGVGGPAQSPEEGYAQKSFVPSEVEGRPASVRKPQ